MKIVSSIFLDFDNIFSGLASFGQRHDVGTKIAHSFASRPSYWLESLSSMRGDENEDVHHHFVVRRCYMNPIMYGSYRGNFVRDGWEVIDTPPLTSSGKTSADMIMAIDILDTVSLYGHVSEFVIMSADADFTPIIIRLRKHLKKTVVYTSINTAAAYRGACDSIIDEQDLASIFLDQPRNQSPVQGPSSQNSKRYDFEDVEKEVISALEKEQSLTLPLATIGHLLRRIFGKEISEQWLGYRELGKLIREIESVELETTVKGPSVRLKSDDIAPPGAGAMSTPGDAGDM